jgi:hypothetical protein
LAGWAAEQLGHLFFQRIQGIGGLVSGLGRVRDFRWRLCGGLPGDGGGPGCGGLFTGRGCGGGLVGFRLFGGRPLPGATKFKAPGCAGGARIGAGRLRRRR